MAAFVHSLFIMSIRKVDIGGEGAIFKYMYKLSSKQELCWPRQVVPTTLTSGVQKCGRALKQMIQCIVFVLGPLPTYAST